MHTKSQALPFPVLVGDIGGTNARFAVVAEAGADTLFLDRVRVADHATIDDAIAAGVIDRGAPHPKSAILAVAGPIEGDAVDLTNSDWIVRPKDLIARFGLSDVVLINDFEAQSLALPGLGPEDLKPIGGGRAVEGAPRLVVGPGTGLGAGALIRAHDTWMPLPGEGGHVDLGPVSARDMALWPHFERVFGRISAEALISGAGLVRLYNGIAAAGGSAARLARPAEVTEGGLSGADPVAVEALDLFATYLGRFAGDLALVFLAHGGVYLGGGIAPRIAEVLEKGGFREAFVAKAPHRDLLEGIPTAIVVKRGAALGGMADYARRPQAFSLDLGGRRWRGGE